MRMKMIRSIALLSAVLFLTCGCSPARQGGSKPQPKAKPKAQKSKYLREQIYDTSVGRDEALVNVRLAASGWPDCYTLKSAVDDIWRLEGVKEASGEKQALALWKWFRILVSGAPGAGSYVYEGRRNKLRLVWGPHRIFTAYGHHQCDGQSWAMVGLWRAAGKIGFDECHWGHTIAALRYRDSDGHYRFHDFDPQGRFYYWHPEKKRVATWTLPVMRGRVYRHITARRKLHSLRTSLRVGETIVRSWENRGHVIPAGKNKLKSAKNKYYAWKAGRTDGVYAAVGEEVQTLEPARDVGRYKSALYDGSANTACSKPEKGKATLHPAEKKKPAYFVYRLAPPYPVADAKIEIKMIKSAPGDICRVWLSTNGKIWRRIVEQVYLGEKQYALNIGRDARFTRRPNAYSAYGFMIKVECQTENDLRSVGVRDMKVTAYRQLSKRALPHLRPGTNYLRVTAGKLTKGLELELSVDYRVNGKPHSVKQVVASFPHYFKVDVPKVAERLSKNYDKHWNDGPLQMSSVRMKLVPAAGGKLSSSLKPSEAQPHFEKSWPHPADMTNRKIAKRLETSPVQTSGFLPQSSARLDDDAKMQQLIKKLDSKKYMVRWHAAEDLGAYPQALPALLKKLPKANIDMTLFICKALAQIKDRRAIGPLLAKWKRGQGGTPGTRYIPDALAAIGDRSVVPHLVAALPKARFDLRFHVAHALGILGGPQAEAALEDLAKNDPFKAVREEAERALAKLRGKS
jgi:HEAT repeats